MVGILDFPHSSEIAKKYNITVPEEYINYHKKLGMCMFICGFFIALAVVMLIKDIGYI